MLVPQACWHGQDRGFPWVGSECAWRRARLPTSPAPGSLVQPHLGPGLPWAPHSPRDCCQEGPGACCPPWGGLWDPSLIVGGWTQPRLWQRVGVHEVRQPGDTETSSHTGPSLKCTFLTVAQPLWESLLQFAKWRMYFLCNGQLLDGHWGGA